MPSIKDPPLSIDEVLSHSAEGKAEEKFREAQYDYYDGPALHCQLSRAYFRKLTRLAPAQLIELISRETLDPADLTFAAEIAGEIEDDQLVVPVLTDLLDHDSSLVREGAIHGLSNHLTSELRSRLHLLALNDASQGVRDAASDALEDSYHDLDDCFAVLEPNDELQRALEAQRQVDDEMWQ